MRIWEGHNVHEDPKNAESYEIEKREVIITVNNFITKLYVDSQRFKKKLDGLKLFIRIIRCYKIADSKCIHTSLYIDILNKRIILLDDYATGEKYEEMEDLMDRVEIAHDLITRLRQLLTMEKTDSVMDHSLNRTRFFKMDDDYSKHIFYLYLYDTIAGTKHNMHVALGGALAYNIMVDIFQKPKTKSEKMFDKKHWSRKGEGCSYLVKP